MEILLHLPWTTYIILLGGLINGAIVLRATYCYRKKIHSPSWMMYTTLVVAAIVVCLFVYQLFFIHGGA